MTGELPCLAEGGWLLPFRKKWRACSKRCCSSPCLKIGLPPETRGNEMIELMYGMYNMERNKVRMVDLINILQLRNEYGIRWNGVKKEMEEQYWT